MKCDKSLVYLNKVFTDTGSRSCPLLTVLETNPQQFRQQLSLYDDERGGGGCCCGSKASITADSNFVVDSTEVIVSDFSLENPKSINRCNVTVDGVPVDSLYFYNDRYEAATNALMSIISDCRCVEKGRSTSGYFLITDASNWKANLTVILRGSVFGCGSCQRFKLLMSTDYDSDLPIEGSSNFAVPSICLPCVTDGIAPVISFSFGATAKLLNPEIRPVGNSGGCDIRVSGNLIVEPSVDVQVTRSTLFSIDAEALNIPCDDLARCRQNPGQCDDYDDDSNAFSLRNRCCNDGPKPVVKEDSSCNENSETENGNSICCQYNGCNGCRI